METLAVNLREVIREVLDSSASADPTTIVRDVLDRIPAAATREALRQALITVVRQEISLGRMRHGSSDTHRASAHPTREPSRPLRTKTDRIREAWRQHLEDRLPGADGWKRLRDFTADDLDFAADLRDAQAAANAAQADRMRALRKALDEEGVTTVGDLSEDTLRNLFG